jgi:hypothetical protein
MMVTRNNIGNPFVIGKKKKKNAHAPSCQPSPSSECHIDGWIDIYRYSSTEAAPCECQQSSLYV